jgi:hypothetical protein
MGQGPWMMLVQLEALDQMMGHWQVGLETEPAAWMTAPNHRKLRNQIDGLNNVGQHQHQHQCNGQSHQTSHSTCGTMHLRLVDKVQEPILRPNNRKGNKDRHGIV